MRSAGHLARAAGDLYGGAAERDGLPVGIHHAERERELRVASNAVHEANAAVVAEHGLCGACASAEPFGLVVEARDERVERVPCLHRESNGEGGSVAAGSGEMNRVARGDTVVAAIHHEAHQAAAA